MEINFNLICTLLLGTVVQCMVFNEVLQNSFFERFDSGEIRYQIKGGEQRGTRAKVRPLCNYSCTDGSRGVFHVEPMVKQKSTIKVETVEHLWPYVEHEKRILDGFHQRTHSSMKSGFQNIFHEFTGELKSTTRMIKEKYPCKAMRMYAARATLHYAFVTCPPQSFPVNAMLNLMAKIIKAVNTIQNGIDATINANINLRTIAVSHTNDIYLTDFRTAVRTGNETGFDSLVPFELNSREITGQLNASYAVHTRSLRDEVTCFAFDWYMVYRTFFAMFGKLPEDYPYVHIMYASAEMTYLGSEEVVRQRSTYPNLFKYYEKRYGIVWPPQIRAALEEFDERRPKGIKPKAITGIRSLEKIFTKRTEKSAANIASIFAHIPADHVM